MMAPRAKKEPKRTKRVILEERIAQYLAEQSGQASPALSASAAAGFRVYDQVITASIGCPHCGSVSAALSTSDPGGCPCACHRVAAILRERAKETKETSSTRRRPTPPRTSEICEWRDTGAAAQYSNHPAAVAGRAAAAEASRLSREPAPASAPGPGPTPTLRPVLTLVRPGFVPTEAA